MLIEVAAQRSDVSALVTDGAAAGSFEDTQRLNGTQLESGIGFVMFSTIRVFDRRPADMELATREGRE